MAENSHISWTDNTFNPWMGCTKVSPACQHCYAERDMDHRYGKVAWGPNGDRIKTTDQNWRKPIRWNRQAAESGKRLYVFCASLADVFEDWKGPIRNANKVPLHHGAAWYEKEKYVPRDLLIGKSLVTMDDLRRDLFALIEATPNLDWLLLTKRPENVERMWPQVGFADAGVPGTLGRRMFFANVILGTSIENQEWTDKRLPHIHAAKRYGLVRRTFVSAEPLVGSVMLHGEHDGKTYRHLGGEGIDWVITGGESGPNARACKPEWFRSLRDQAEAAGVPFHFKQWGEFDVNENRVGVKVAGRELDGQTHDGLPRVASV